MAIHSKPQLVSGGLLLGCWMGKYRILGECLLISSLPGKALRTLVDITRLAEQFNMRSQSLAW